MASSLRNMTKYGKFTYKNKVIDLHSNLMFIILILDRPQEGRV